MSGFFACLAVCTGLTALPGREEIPIQCRPGERAILEVEAVTEAGKPRTLRMILDTGADLCVVDATSAKGLVNGLFQRMEATGFAGRRRTTLKRTLIGLCLGKVSQSSVHVLVMDLGERNKWLDEPVDGLLGMSFLRGRRFLVDPVQARFVWEGEVPSRRSFPLRSRGSYFYVPMRLAGRELEALMDTGASGTLYTAFTPRGLTLEVDCELGSGIDGFVRLGRTRADLELFGEFFRRRPIWIGGSSSAILGSAFLLAGPTAFDLEKGQIHLSVDAEGKLLRAPSMPTEVSFPICWNRKGREPFLEVAPMPDCHRWYRAGFRTGDRVLAVGPAAERELSLSKLNSLLLEGQVLPWSLRRKDRILELQNPSEDRRLERLEEEELSPPSPPATASKPPAR
jgi:hypothetical protein